MNIKAAITMVCIFALPQSAYAAEEQSRIFQNWRLTLSIDPISDERRAIATVMSDAGNAALVVKCDPGGRGMYVSYIAPDFLGSTRRNRGREVTYRIDSRSPVSSDWSHTDRAANLFDSYEVARFVTAASEGSSIFMRATTYRFRHSEARFSLLGSRAAIQAAYEGCGYPLPGGADTETSLIDSMDSETKKPLEGSIYSVSDAELMSYSIITVAFMISQRDRTNIDILTLSRENGMAPERYIELTSLIQNSDTLNSRLASISDVYRLERGWTEEEMLSVLNYNSDSEN